MKLRIRGDSIRLRLTRAEVRELVERGEVAERTRLPAGAGFGYRLRADAGGGGVSASFTAGVLCVAVPRAAVEAWAASEEAAIGAELPLPEGALAILVEKDFPCLAVRAGEDDSGAFARDRLKLER
jgi:hypothetical protein